MIQTLLNIRLKQVYRLLSQAGILRAIFIIGVFVFLLVYMFHAVEEQTGAYIATALFSITILVVHRSRPDFRFLEIHTLRPKAICFAEYMICSAPLIVTLLIYNWWLLVLAYLVAILIISQTASTSFFSTKSNQLLINLIPAECYEWKVGFRKTQYFIVFFWLMGAVGSFHIAAVPFAIFLIGFTIQSFYEKHEPYQVILALGQNQKFFLWNKVKWLVVLFSVLILPLTILFMYHNYDLWHLVGIEYLLFISWYVYTIFSKYAFYNPNGAFSSSQIYAMIGLLAFFIPLFLPLSWVMTIRFYFKSKSSLSLYLNDYN